ncbi:zinc finger protein 888 [Anopheles funestus]|uniref:zinc finger protein 888 n=1 Tax=Anopheles funestus TaxID=62324 RepID=UPI0020C62C60|nr:zinc finger protein 888 [Anopheles funestus]
MSETSCRLCLGEVHPDDRGSSIREVLFRSAINRVFSFEIKHDDGLPIYTCNDCSQQVWDFNSYSQLVQRNQNTLEQTHLQESKPLNATESTVLYPIDPDKIKKETGITNEESENSVTVPEQLPEGCGLLAAIKTEPTDCDEQVEPVLTHDVVKCEFNFSDTEENTQVDRGADRDAVSETAAKDETVDNNESESDLDGDSNDDEASNTQREESITSANCKNLIEKMRERIRERIAANKVVFRCELCDRSYPNERYLKTHNAVVHAPYVRRKLWFPCNLCNRSFSHQTLLAEHRKTHAAGTGGTAKGKVSEAESTDGSEPAPDAYSFRCNECCKTFTCHKSLQTHTDVMHPFMVREPQTYSCDQCDRTFDECRKLTKHRRKHKFQQCPVCMKQLLKQNIGTHILAHQGVFRCDVCGKALSCKKSLKRHLETIHASPADRINHKYMCSLCPRKFYHIAHLQNHRQYHIMQKCPLCDKQVRKSHLYEHVAAHKGAYRCKPCDKLYTSKLGLKIHEKQKHGAGV